jgi:cobaltochelatase CobT
MNRAMLLREKIGKLPVILSHTGARITQEGSSAFVKCDADGKPVLVNLPYLADDAAEELMDAIEGFLDHEVAHLMFTDFKLTKKSAEARFGTLHGWIEDTFVERQLARRFPGCAANLTETGRFFLARGIAPALALAQVAGDSQQVMAVLMAAALRAWAGQPIYQDFMHPYWPLLQDVTTALGTLVDEVGLCQSTADTYCLAQKMHEVLCQLDPELFNEPVPQEGDQAAPDGQQGQSQQHRQDARSQSSASDCSQPEEAGDAQPGMPAQAQETAEGQVLQGGQKNALDRAPQFDAITQDNATGAHGEDAGGQPAQDLPAGQKEAGKATRFLNALEHAAHSFDDQLMKLIGDYAEQSIEHSDYLVYSSRNDAIEPLKVPDTDYREEYLQELEQQVAALCGPMQKHLERIIVARSIAAWQPGRRSGHMHAANLARLATGDDRVFRKKQEGLSRDVAVELVVDCSASMRHAGKIELAAQSAYALAMVLERLNIANEVIGFTTSRSDCIDDAVGEYRDTYRYSRTEALYLPILKGYHERMTADVRKRFAFLPRCGRLRNNVDGESVEIAARRLAARREKGKIMLVLSDGYPHAEGDVNAQRYYLKKTVEQIEAAGIKIVGLGIISDAVEHYYEKSIVVQELADLPGEVLKQLKALIVGM